MGNTKLKERLMSANGTTTALAVTESSTNFVALKSNALDIIRENLKNQPLSMSLFDIVEVSVRRLDSVLRAGLVG